ncbi:hypothetical protein KFK09_020983 [Dendrobium nobile]|uniref:NAC domain-containing protein n=1 Tax=Dendrobium nobile TaxID=94219 RepID=A0A8T3ANY3_DENNO|nr:hypothetical protein KFK09_020983 [Dendrobium nobile]
MHEYRLAESSAASARLPGDYSAAAKKGFLRLHDWVICRIYKKSNNQRSAEREKLDNGCIHGLLGPPAHDRTPQLQLHQPRTLNSSTANYTALLDSADEIFFDGILASDDCQIPACCRENSAISPATKHLTFSTMENITPSAKRFQTTTSSGGGGGNGSAASILNLLNLQIPQQLEEAGVVSLFRQPYSLSEINWSS